MSARSGFCAAALAIVLSGCAGPGGPAASFNEGASLSGTLPWNPLQGRVITSTIDQQAATMSTLYGNDAAVRSARGGGHEYPAGAILALVTWTEQDDARWFGGKIPRQVKSVEFVTVTAGPGDAPSYQYESYQGAPLQRTAALDGNAPGSRPAYLLSLRAAVMP